jgi:hypothetical protein
MSDDVALQLDRAEPLTYYGFEGALVSKVFLIAQRCEKI